MLSDFASGKSSLDTIQVSLTDSFKETSPILRRHRQDLRLGPF